VQEVMKINGILSEMIFKHNQYRTETRTDEKTRPVGAAVVSLDPQLDPETGLPPTRSFYVEESYAMPWMYPYLTPHGLIMKVNNKPTPITDRMIKDDTDFWNWYCDRLLNDEKFIRDIVARKSFSKLRSSIASLYAARNHPKEAEVAYRQAIAFYDLSPESNYRMAELFTRQRRYVEAIELQEAFLSKDPKNEQAEQFLNQLKWSQKTFKRVLMLEEKKRSETLQFHELIELAGIHLSSGQPRKADAILLEYIRSESITPDQALHIGQLAAKKQRIGVIEQALKTVTRLKPEDPSGWIDLAALQLFLKQPADMWKTLDKAIAASPERAPDLLRSDPRFDPVRNSEAFMKRVPVKQQQNINTELLPGF
jgi:tetratricopeptide (TPR) repeat protein